MNSSSSEKEAVSEPQSSYREEVEKKCKGLDESEYGTLLVFVMSAMASLMTERTSLINRSYRILFYR